MSTNRFHYPLGSSSAYVWYHCAASPHLSALAAEPVNAAATLGNEIHDDAAGEASLELSARYRSALLRTSTRWNFEQRVQGIHPMMGTFADAIAIEDDVAYIVDLKTGQEPVSPVDNFQLLSTAAMLVSAGLEVPQFLLGIYQEHDDGTPPMKWCCLTLAAIQSWIGKFQEAAERSYGGNAQCSTGPWCHKCRGKGACEAYSKELAALTPAADRSPSTLTSEQAAQLLRVWPKLERFAKAVKATWMASAEAGALPGLKVQHRKGRLQWREVEGAPVLPPEWYDRKPITPTQVIDRGLASEDDLVSAGFAERGKPIQVLVAE